PDSSSVGPTASVSMLKPRRANRPAIRVRTPGLFSTRIESTCLRPVRRPPTTWSSSSEISSFVPGSPMAVPSRLATSPHHVPRGLPGGDHRVGVLLSRDPHVDEHWPVGGDRVAHVLHERGLVLEAQPGRAVGLGQL